jgi:Spy/CpxP family protein refolding chaperone
MTSRVRIALLFAAVAAAALFAARAFAHGHGPFSWKGHLERKIDGALDAAKATPAQRASVHAAVEHVVTTAEDTHQGRGAEMEQAIALFEADKLDQAAIAKHRAAHEASAKKVSDAVVQAIFDTHDALTAEQRRAVADWARAQHAQHNMAGGHGDFRAEMFHKMISARIDDALDAIKATDAQRATAHAAAGRVFDAFSAAHKSRGADLERALALFTADKLDVKAVEALRTEHLAQMKHAGDAIVQAIGDVHDALDAGQRRALVEYLKAHRPRWSHHG